MLNHTGMSSAKGKTPYEVWTQRRTDLNQFRVLGSKVMVHIPKNKWKKWDAKPEEGIMIGYSDTVKDYRIWFPKRSKVEVHRDVIFKEEEMYKNTVESVVREIPEYRLDDTESLEEDNNEHEPEVNEEENESFTEEDTFRDAETPGGSDTYAETSIMTNDGYECNAADCAGPPGRIINWV